MHQVSRSGVSAFARATGERDARCLSVSRAREAGHPDLVAPPMYAAVYAGHAFRRALADAVGDGARARAVHGAQALRWFALVHAGDEIETQARATGATGAGPLNLVEIATRSLNAGGELVSLGRWTVVLRR